MSMQMCIETNDASTQVQMMMTSTANAVMQTATDDEPLHSLRNKGTCTEPPMIHMSTMPPPIPCKPTPSTAMLWKGRLTEPSSLHFQGFSAEVSSGQVYLVKCPSLTFPLYKLLLLIINTESSFMPFPTTVLICAFLCVFLILKCFSSTQLLPFFKCGVACFFFIPTFIFISQISSFIITFRVAFLPSFIKGFGLHILQELQYNAL